MTEKLTMSFDRRTIEHLGVKMYSTLPPVLAELVANSYDAGASQVFIDLNDQGDLKTIVVTDNGVGMSLKDMDEKFLTIGRNRRADVGDQTSKKGRKPIGKKGLGKLAFFGITDEIIVTSICDKKRNSFSMNWDKLMGDEKEYHPTLLQENVMVEEDNGTSIELKNIKRVSDFNAGSIANSLSKIFIVDDGFQIYVRRNREEYTQLDNEAKYAGLDIEFEWAIPESGILDSEYAKENNISGRIIATKKPISPSTNMRGITIFSRQKLVNNPDNFSVNQSSHFFSYITGRISADFIDDLNEDVISTNRQSLNWDHLEMQTLLKKLQQMMRLVEIDWRKKRSTIRINNVSEKVGVNLVEWYEKIPESVRNSVDPIVRMVVEESELDADEQVETISNLRKLAPDYTYFHYRQLHPKIRAVASKHYQDKNYYSAFLEAMKKYIAECRNKAQVPNDGDENSQLERALKTNPVVLSAIGNYKKADGSAFHANTINNIQNAFRELSIAIYKGGRHPLSHEEIIELKNSDLFSEADCLDALSLLSHLFKRLENSVKV